MSYSAQKLVNYLPFWSKSRKDPSSNTYKLMQSLGDSLSLQTKDAVKNSYLFQLMAEEATHGEMTEIFLLEEDKIRVTMTGTRKGYEYPKVKGIVSEAEVTVERARNISEFLYSAPTRVEGLDSIDVLHWEIWSSTSASTPKDIKIPERLLIEVKNSTIYYRKDSVRNEDRVSGYTSFVFISGLDQDFNSIDEIVAVTDDGCYTTRNIFKTVDEITFDGFDGDVTVYLTPSKEALVDETFVRYKYSSGYTKTDSGPIRLYLIDESHGTTLVPAINKQVQGKNYLRPENKIQEEEIEALCSHSLLDTSGSYITALSATVSPLDTNLYVLDNSGRVFIYQPDFTAFVEPEEKASEETYLDIQPEVHRVDLNEEIDLWTFFRVQTAPIVHAVIKRVDPAGTEEYLQADLSWGVTEYKFLGKDSEGTYVEKSWEDFSFPVTFNQVGQWNFYCTAYMPVIKGQYFTSRTAVMVESMSPIAEYDLEVGEEIFFDKENLLCIKQGNTYKRFGMYRDLYVADPVSQRVLLKEQYDEIEIYHE